MKKQYLLIITTLIVIIFTGCDWGPTGPYFNRGDSDNSHNNEDSVCVDTSFTMVVQVPVGSEVILKNGDKLTVGSTQVKEDGYITTALLVPDSNGSFKNIILTTDEPITVVGNYTYELKGARPYFDPVLNMQSHKIVLLIKYD